MASAAAAVAVAGVGRRLPCKWCANAVQLRARPRKRRGRCDRNVCFGVSWIRGGWPGHLPGLSACCGVQVPASACKRRGECVQMHANAWPGLAWPALRAGPAWPALRRLGGGGRATTAGGGRRPAGCFPLASATQSGRSGGLLDTSSLPHCRRRLFGMVQRVGTWGIRDSAGRAEVVNQYHCSLIRPSPCDLKVGRFCPYLS